MKRFLLLAVAIFLAINISAQKINIVGTWKEKGVDRTWIFSADGTKTLKGSQQVTYPIGGINCTFDLIQSRTDEKWTLNGKNLSMVTIPLNKLTIGINYQKYGNYTAAQKQKINAAIPAFKQQVIRETRQGWSAGYKSTYIIRDYSPMQMVLDLDGQEFVLVRDVSKMTAAQKAALEKDMKVQKPINNEEKVFDVVEEMPSFPGGIGALMSWLSQNIKYPAIAAENGVQGRVIVQFIVEKDGSITNVKVAKSVDPSLDKEAARVVSTMPKWIPGKKGGSPARVNYTVPVTFKP